MTDPVSMPSDAPKPSLLLKAFRAGATTAVTLVIAAGAVLAVQSSAGILQERADAVEIPQAAAPVPVSAFPVNYADGYTISRGFLGQVEPQRTVSLSFELPGRLDSILVDEGDVVEKGQVVAIQDTGLLKADHARLTASRRSVEAQLHFAEQTVERNEALSSRGFTTEAAFDEALARRDELTARIAEIDAALQDNALRIEKASIVAPFNGKVTERRVDGGESLGSGQTVLEIVQAGAPRVRVGVPLDVTEERLSQAEVDVNGLRHPANLIALRPDIDPQTRTRTALFELRSDLPAAFGQTARLVLEEQVEAPGVWVGTTQLKEGLRGQWTVLLADQENIVRSASVEILHAESDRVFVRGAFPDNARIIDQGPQRVTIGQTVTIRSADAEG